MTTMVDILGRAVAGTPRITVYPNYLVFDRWAVRLLGITADEPYIRFSHPVGKDNVICVNHTSSPSGLRTKLKSRRAIINSKAVCSHIADTLQGYGTYRIQEEYHTINQHGERCFELFFKKYNNYVDKNQTRNVTNETQHLLPATLRQGEETRTLL